MARHHQADIRQQAFGSKTSQILCANSLPALFTIMLNVFTCILGVLFSIELMLLAVFIQLSTIINILTRQERRRT
jgi:hypothetical protein